MAAAAGYKTFNTGDVLTASDLMTYVMDLFRIQDLELDSV